NPSLVYTKEALAELWDVEDSELLNLLAIEGKLITIDITLQQLLKDHSSSFGGTYIDVKKNQVFVNTVNPSVVPIIKSSSAFNNNDYLNFITFVTKSNSMDILAYRIIKIYEKIKQFKPINILCYIDIELNNVVIRHDQKTNDEFINSVREYNPIFVQFEVGLSHPRCNENNDDIRITQFSISRRDLNLKILSGEGLINLFNDLGCSVGFWARDKKNANLNYIVTAGHCSSKLSRLVDTENFAHMAWDSTERNLLGRMVESKNIGKYDFGLIDITGSKFLKSVTTLIRNTDSEKYSELIIERGIQIVSHGAHVCKSGFSSHVTCGYIKGLITISTFLEGIPFKDFVFYGKDTFQISCGGDSGGPLFSYLQNLNTVGLSGIHIGGIGDFSIFLPLNIILSKDIISVGHWTMSSYKNIGQIGLKKWNMSNFVPIYYNNSNWHLGTGTVQPITGISNNWTGPINWN
ncbi:16648_t:CDS:2, partial [Dentiscutata erythropus]